LIVHPFFGSFLMRFSSTVVALGLVCLSGWVAAQNLPAGAASTSAPAVTPAVAATAAPAVAPATAPAVEKSAQQNKMTVCNKQAEGKKGDERKAFMKDCLSANKQEKQQNKMKTCNADAAGKKGDERKAFMSACLKK
jgi:hypothetical protein